VRTRGVIVIGTLVACGGEASFSELVPAEAGAAVDGGSDRFTLKPTSYSRDGVRDDANAVGILWIDDLVIA
jgi:hypothetical protein